MTEPCFVHLRAHTEFSISDSIVRLDALVGAAAADNQPAVAITDLSNVFGWIKFYKAARKRGVKPLLGVDCWLTNSRDRDRAHRILLLVRNQQGYLRLCKLLSRAWIENEWRGRGELLPEWFDEGPAGVNDGLIGLSGATHGDVGQALLAGNEELAAKLAKRWQKRFGGDYFVELQRSGRPDDETCTRASARLASRLDLPVVATHPVQFMERGHYQAHEARVCIAQGEILANPRRVRNFSPEQYFKSQSEMAELFADLPEALANAVEIARRCNLEMVLGKPQLPDFPTPVGVTLDDYLRELAHAGLDERLAAMPGDESESAQRRESYGQRLEYECAMIAQMGFSGYFLIVADFINWAKANRVPVGPGRGSGAGSLVAYALGITDLDPIPYGLLFERFLNPERVSLPDFDIDFCQDRRHLVIDYVRAKYGADAVSQIATFGTMASRAVIRDVGRVLDMGYNFCDQLSKLIPVEQGKPLSLAKAREREEQLRERERKEVEVRELLALAEPLEDLARSVGTHAGGVLIAPGKLTDFCPLYRQPGAESGAISQFDKDDVEAVGLVKFDFLGLRNLTSIELAVEYIRARHPGKEIDLPRIGFDDPATYAVLREANTTAVFQLESEGMKKLVKKLQADRFEDIVAVLALYRPGPLGSGMVDDFIMRKKGKQTIDYFHPDLKPCLEPTYGVIVYQEQVMQIAQTIGGYTLGGADLLRRAMGKKKPEEMAKHRVTFVAGAVARGYGEVLANRLFDLMAMFAEYGFNKSHSAAYAVLTYQTAWLKAHYPAEFIAATLSCDMGDTDKVQVLVVDAKANGVTILGPDVNSSTHRFEPVGESAVRYGLGAIKGAGEAAVRNIIAARATGPFTDLYDFCARIDRKCVNRRAIEALVRAGAFDATDTDRARLLANVGRAIDLADARAADIDQVSLFGDDDQEQAQAPQWLPATPWSPRQRLQEEKAALGLFLSGHLFDDCAAEVRKFARTRLCDLQPQPQPVWLAGIVSAQRTQMTRRGKMLFVRLDDGSGAIEVSVFSETLEAQRAVVREDELLVVLGKVSKDDFTGGLRVVADRLLELSEARSEFGKRLQLVAPGGVDVALLRSVLLPFAAQDNSGQGTLPVVVVYLNGSAGCTIELGGPWRVRPDEALLAELRERLRPQSAAVEY